WKPGQSPTARASPSLASAQADLRKAMPPRALTMSPPTLPAASDTTVTAARPLISSLPASTLTMMTARIAPAILVISPHIGQFGGQGSSGPVPPPPDGNGKRQGHPVPHHPTIAGIIQSMRHLPLRQGAVLNCLTAH